MGRFGCQAGVGFWFMASCCAALLGCGGRSSDRTQVDPDAAVAGAAGSLAAGGRPGSGGRSGNGGTPPAYDGGAAGSLASGGTQLTIGGAVGAGGLGGVVDLCLYPDEIPANWSAPGDAGASGETCPVGQLGEFELEGCRYELLVATAHDVDPFVGGHSRCCYRSRPLACTE